MNLNDRIALELGRAQMRALIAEAQVEQFVAQKAVAEAKAEKDEAAPPSGAEGKLGDRASESIEGGELMEDQQSPENSGERAASPGLGAWSHGYYRFGYAAGDDPRKRAGVIAVKRALIDAGFAKGVDLTQFVFGNAATNRAFEFQAARGIPADGVVGPETARLLWRTYTAPAEDDHGIPNHWLGRIATGESANDPVAEGVIDADDEGLLQIHLPFHPDVSLEEAWDPRFALNWGADRLTDDLHFTGSWRGAVAAHNIGRTYAKDWVAADYPATGGPTMGKDAAGNTIYAYERATKYLAYVRDLPF